MSFFAKKAELALVFDIASSSVGAALVRLSRGENARVLYTLREPVLWQEEIDPDKLFRDMVEVLRKIQDRIVKEGSSHLSGTEWSHLKISEVFYSFSSPWAATQTKTLSIKKPEAFIFDRNLMNGLIKNEEEKFKREAFGKSGEGKVLPDSLTVIERRIIQTKLNGYDIKDPFGKRVTEAEISYFSGIVPKSVVEKIMEISHRSHIKENIHFLTFPLVSYGVIREVFHGDNDFITLRIGGEITDIGIVEDGLITESGSLPRGVNYILESLSKSLLTTKEETISRLRMHIEKHASLETADELLPLMERLMREWASSLKSAIENLQGNIFIPQKIYMAMDGELAECFKKSLSEYLSMNVVPIEEATLKQSVKYEGAMKDAPLSMIAAFVKRVFESEGK